MIKKILFHFIFVLIPFSGITQSIATYSTVRNIGTTYVSINSTGNAFSTWRNLGAYAQDDNRSDFTDIGFDFWYNGTRYSQFSVSTNGFMDFSNSTDDGGPVPDAFGFNNTAFTNANMANATRPAIAPFYDDLTAQGGTEALGNSIKYLLTGTAPNRTLTVEWINMAVYLNATPSLNFQVQLVEKTGVILINYGTMITGTNMFSYSMGINSATLTVAPTAAQLKMLQTANGTVLNNTIQNNLSAMPAANSQYVFSPPAPTPTAGLLSFSAVSSSAITLNWPNWATNEVGYVIYNSTDGINYSFVSQVAVNSSSAMVSGLTSGTNYFWKLHAVTDGYLGDPLTGNQATSAAGTKTSVASGNWNAATTWSPASIPTAGEDVTIANGHLVSITSTAQCNSLIVGQGTAATLQFLGAANSFTVNNNITVNTNAVFRVAPTSGLTHSLISKGNITNNGSIDLNTSLTSLCNTYFIKAGNQVISGTATLNRFNLINMNMGNSINNTLEITATTFTAPANFLTLTNGTFKLSTVNSVSITLFTPLTSIPQTAGVWLNSATAVLNTGAGITLTGKLSVSNGTLNVGNAADEDLLSSGGNLVVTGGQLNIAGKYYASGINNLCYVTISGGTLTVPTSASTSQTIAPFQIIGAGSKFNMSAGLLVIAKEGGNGTQDLGFVNTVTAGSVTGGTLQIGNTLTPAASTININTNYFIGNLSVNSVNAVARLNTNSLSVIGNVAINSGTLNTNNFGISLGGNWTRSSGSFVPGTVSVTFNSNTAQAIASTGGEIFNHLLFSGSGVKTFSTAVTTNGNFSVSAGASVDVSAANNRLTVKGNYINNGTFNARLGLVYFNGTTAQTLGGSSITNFNDITLGNPAGASLTGAENLLGTLTLTTGVFNTNAQVFTMISTATATARIAEITGSGNILGNVTVQRYAPGGTTGWALMGTPISSALTYNDWDDDMPISCPTCPDGSAGGFLSIYTYDEALPGLYDAPASYIPINTINDPITPNKGYWVYFGDGQFTTSNITIDVTGTVNKLNTAIPLKYTNFGSPPDDGWNLITNPYPSAISWTALKGITPNIDNAVYVYNADLNAGAGGFASYVNGVSSPAVGSGGVGNTIPMSQGFYVHSTGATSLNAVESNKVAGNPTYLKTSASTSANLCLLRINLNGVNGFNDETVLYLQTFANDYFDEAYDSYKMRGQDPFAPFVALEKGPSQFQINAVAPITGNFSIPLKALTGYTGTYTLSASNLSTFPNGACINLYDKFLNTTTNLKTNSYVFNLADTTTVARFNLNITINPLPVSSMVNNPSCQLLNNGEIIAAGITPGPWNYYWTSNGIPVKTSLNKFSADTLNNLGGGNFDLEINSVGMCDNNNLSFQITPQTTSFAQFNSIDTLDLNQSVYIMFNNTTTGAVSYLWNFGDGAGTSTNVSPIYNYFNPGTYTITLVSWSSSGCTDTAKKVITVLANPTSIGSNGMNTSGLIVKTSGNNEFVFEQLSTVEVSSTFQLMDLQGRLLKDYGTLTSQHIQLPVNLQEFSAGVYLMTITSGNQRRVIKLPVK